MRKTAFDKGIWKKSDRTVAEQLIAAYMCALRYVGAAGIGLLAGGSSHVYWPRLSNFPAVGKRVEDKSSRISNGPPGLS